MPLAQGLARTLVILAVLLGGTPAARAQSACAVLDPELQGGYEGGCANGKAEGQGTAKGRSTYAGEFHLGMKHGRGVKTWSRGDRYDGEFAEDNMSGWGIYTWGPGSVFAGERYEGGFAHDKRNGFGLYVWPSGDSYAGPWKDDAIVGRASPMMIARTRATGAAMEALAKPRTKVCHLAIVGSGSTKSTEGETQAVDAAARQVSIRVTTLGPAPTLVAGAQLAVGDVVWDDPLNWVPCN